MRLALAIEELILVGDDGLLLEKVEGRVPNADGVALATLVLWNRCRIGLDSQQRAQDTLNRIVIGVDC